jgi:hypothetical protein
MNSMKVVINRDYRGFGLSKPAIRLYNQLTQWRIMVPTGIGKKPHGDRIFDFEVDRDDPVLVQVVETLGYKAASGEFSKLGIVEVSLAYDIKNYDGKETVEPSAWAEPIREVT